MADGLYSPACATARLVLDQLAVATFVSFCVVGIMHGVLWHRVISGERPPAGVPSLQRKECFFFFLKVTFQLKYARE